MAVDMGELWNLTSEVVNHTSDLIGLVVLGVIITCAYAVGTFVTNILHGATKKGK